MMKGWVRGGGEDCVLVEIAHGGQTLCGHQEGKLEGGRGCLAHLTRLSSGWGPCVRARRPRAPARGGAGR